MRKTKIICTLGPAVDNDEMVKKLIQNGMNCARFNFSHGTHEEHRERMNRVKRISEEMNVPIALMMDTKGPEIRLKNFAEGSVVLETGQKFTLDDSEELGDINRVGISYGKLYKSIKAGTKILIDDGKVELKAESAEEGRILCRVINGGKISNHKSLNVPNVVIPMEYISEADRLDILFGISQDVDYVAASFVRSENDAMQLRALLDNNGGENIRIISKIENGQGVKNINKIIDASDGIMVARGDLGVEIPFKEIPAIQKSMIEKCNQAGKLVVTATQMLESMTKNPRPTRAEVSDVANAVFDGTTAIMLSGESAAGDYPAEAVKTMAEIAMSSEKSIKYNRNHIKDQLKVEKNIVNAVCASAYSAAEYLNARAIVVVTRSGNTARAIAGFRPANPIIAITLSEKGMRQLNLEWGVKPMPAEHKNSADELFQYATEKALESGIVKSGDTIVMVTVSDTQRSAVNDIIRICTV